MRETKVMSGASKRARAELARGQLSIKRRKSTSHGWGCLPRGQTANTAELSTGTRTILKDDGLRNVAFLPGAATERRTAAAGERGRPAARALAAAASDLRHREQRRLPRQDLPVVHQGAGAAAADVGVVVVGAPEALKLHQLGAVPLGVAQLHPAAARHLRVAGGSDRPGRGFVAFLTFATLLKQHILRKPKF